MKKLFILERIAVQRVFLKGNALKYFRTIMMEAQYFKKQMAENYLKEFPKLACARTIGGG